MGIVLQSIYSVSKELNIPPLSVKFAIARVRCFKKMEKKKTRILSISVLLQDKSLCRPHLWEKESKILGDKLNKLPSKKKKQLQTFIGIEIWQENQSRIRLIRKINLRKLETTESSTLNILNIALVSDGYFVPDVDINSKLMLLKPPIGLKTTVQKGCPRCYRKYRNPRLEHWFSKSYLFYEFQMKYFMDIEKLYEKYFVISKYCQISNSNVNTFG